MICLNLQTTAVRKIKEVKSPIFPPNMSGSKGQKEA